MRPEPALRATVLPRRAVARAWLALVLIVCGAAVAGDQEGPLRVFLPDELHWVPNKSVPAGMTMTMLYGDPRQPGPFIFRAKIPAGYRLPPHRHPDERIVTVLSGTYYSGVGEKFDRAALRAYPPGSFYVTPADTPHFAWVESGEVIIQESGFGPKSGIDYVDPADDPRPR